MGICSSKETKFVVDMKTEGQDDSVLEVAKLLGLSERDVDMLYGAFRAIDQDESGAILPSELYAFFSIEAAEFETKLFTLFDDDKSNNLNFMEFVAFTWNLLTLPETHLGSLPYLMRDPTGTLKIRYIDVKVILELMHHRKLETSSTLQALYDNMKKEFEIELSMLEFCKWTAANASVVTPVLMLQLKIRKQIIGENFWLKLTNARKQDSIKGKLEFVSKLRKIVHDKNEKYRQRLVENRINGLRVNSTEKLSAGSQNVKRKESFLLKAFNMAPNAPKGRSPGNAEVYPDDKKDEVGTPKSELREKPSPVISSSSKKRIKDGSSRKLHDKEGSDNRISEDEAVIRRNSGSSRDLNKKMRSSKSSKKLETKDKSMRKLESSKKLGELKVNKSQKMKLKG